MTQLSDEISLLKRIWLGIYPEITYNPREFFKLAHIKEARYVDRTHILYHQARCSC